MGLLFAIDLDLFPLILDHLRRVHVQVILVGPFRVVVVVRVRFQLKGLFLLRERQLVLALKETLVLRGLPIEIICLLDVMHGFHLVLVLLNFLEVPQRKAFQDVLRKKVAYQILAKLLLDLRYFYLDLLLLLVQLRKDVIIQGLDDVVKVVVLEVGVEHLDPVDVDYLLVEFLPFLQKELHVLLVAEL